MLLNYNSSLTAISSTNTLSPDVMSHLTGKDPNTGKDGEEGGREMVRQHHQLNGHDLEQTPGDSGGKKSVACCSP